MMREARRYGPAEATRQLDLLARRLHQVLTANHEVHPLIEIVDGDRELVSPVPQPIPHRDVAVLRRYELPPPGQQIVDDLDLSSGSDPPDNTIGQGNGPLATAARTALYFRRRRLSVVRALVAARTEAAVQQAGGGQGLGGPVVDRLSILLAGRAASGAKGG